MQAPQPFPHQQVVYVQQAPILNTKNTGLAIFLAFLWPGLDRFYLDDTTKGILLFIAAPILVVIIIGIPVYCGLWIYGMATASRRATEFNVNLIGGTQTAPPSQYRFQE